MKTYTPEQFAALLANKEAEIRQLIEDKLPQWVGNEAVIHFKKNFQNEGFGRGPSEWTEVQRRQSWTRTYKYASTTDRSRKILTGKTGDLGRSIQYSVETGKAIIHSDLIYAAVHNEGLKAGRGAGFTMPKRQFIGDDPELEQKIKEKIELELNKLLKL